LAFVLVYLKNGIENAFYGVRTFSHWQMHFTMPTLKRSGLKRITPNPRVFRLTLKIGFGSLAL
jgi:hypothetical protein